MPTKIWMILLAKMFLILLGFKKCHLKLKELKNVTKTSAGWKRKNREKIPSHFRFEGRLKETIL